MFGSNVSKLKVFLGVFIAIAIGVVFTYNAIYKVMHWPYVLDAREHRWTMAKNEQWVYPSFYRDSPDIHREDFYGPSIQSDEIEGNFLKLVLPYDVDFDDHLENDQYIEEGLDIYIDDSLYNVEWYNYRPRENDQLGMKAMISIRHLDFGKHELKIQDYFESDNHLIIPFWKG